MDIQDLPPLTLKKISPAQNLVEIAERTQFNFDQILMHGGGKMGKPGKDGKRGLPGRTGIGEKGEIGEIGSEMFFTPTININDNDDPLVITPAIIVKEKDVVIDDGGDYFKVVKVNDDLRYQFRFNINTASIVNPYWLDQDEYDPSGIVERILVNWDALPTELDKIAERNLVAAKKVGTTSEFYRVLLGLDEYPAPQNSTLFISNIPHDDTASAGDQFFAQVGFKYRDTATGAIGANTAWVVYKEESANDRFLFSINNNSVGAYWKHDTADADDSAYIIKGANVQFIGQSVDIDSITEYLYVNVALDLATITSQKNLTIKTDAGVGAGSVASVEYEQTWVKSDAIILSTFDPSATKFQIAIALKRLEVLVLNEEFHMIATKVDLDTIALEIGATSGATTTTFTLRQKLRIAGSKILDIDVDTEVNKVEAFDTQTWKEWLTGVTHDVTSGKLELNNGGNSFVVSLSVPIKGIVKKLSPLEEVPFGTTITLLMVGSGSFLESTGDFNLFGSNLSYQSGDVFVFGRSDEGTKKWILKSAPHRMQRDIDDNTTVISSHSSQIASINTDRTNHVNHIFNDTVDVVAPLGGVNDLMSFTIPLLTMTLVKEKMEITAMFDMGDGFGNNNAELMVGGISIITVADNSSPSGTGSYVKIVTTISVRDALNWVAETIVYSMDRIISAGSYNSFTKMLQVIPIASLTSKIVKTRANYVSSATPGVVCKQLNLVHYRVPLL